MGMTCVKVELPDKTEMQVSLKNRKISLLKRLDKPILKSNRVQYALKSLYFKHFFHGRGAKNVGR